MARSLPRSAIEKPVPGVTEEAVRKLDGIDLKITDKPEDILVKVNIRTLRSFLYGRFGNNKVRQLAKVREFLASKKLNWRPVEIQALNRVKNELEQEIKNGEKIDVQVAKL